MIKKWLTVIVALTLFTGCIHTVGETKPVARVKWNYHSSPYSQEEAIEKEKISLDLSTTGQGYVGIKNTEYERICLTIETQDKRQNHILSQREEPYIIPLEEQGQTTFRVYKNLHDNSYTPLFEESKEVVFEDDFAPWIRPNDYVNFTEKDAVVGFAHGIYVFSKDDKEFINRVLTYVIKTISYDQEKAEDVKSTTLSTYRSDAYETYSLGNGICYDFAVMTAAMLRSQGIPTRVAIGTVKTSRGVENHAWNEIYVDGEWKLYDTTFTAQGKLVTKASANMYKAERYF